VRREVARTLARLALLVGLSLFLALVQGWIILAAAAGALAILALVLGLPRGTARLLVAVGLLGLPMLYLVFVLSGREATGAWAPAFRWGLVHMAPYSLRMGDLALANLLFIQVTSLAEIMEALKALRLPDPVVLFLSTVLRFMPQILLEARRVVDAQRCRGLTSRKLLTPPGLLAVFVPLFLGQVQRSRDLAISLEVRGAAFSCRAGRRLP